MIFSVIIKCLFLQGIEQTGTLKSLQKYGAGYLQIIHQPNLPLTIFYSFRILTSICLNLGSSDSLNYGTELIEQSELILHFSSYNTTSSTMCRRVI